MNDEFWDIVNQYIKTANDVKDQTSMPQASSSLLYAAARYNALNIINNYSEDDRNDRIKEHIEIYEEFLRNSFDHLLNER